MRLRATAIVLLAAWGAATAAPVPRGEATLPADRRGLHAAGVSFFTGAFAATVEEDGKKKVKIAYGDLEEIRWKDGILPVVDAQIVIANLTDVRLVDLPIHVTVYAGVSVLSDMPIVIAPGAEGITEEVFFERTLVVEEILPLGLGRVALRDIQLARAIEEFSRQKIWPTYLRVEATIEKVPPKVDLLTPKTSGYLRILP